MPSTDRCTPRARRGAALLEAIVALTILATAGAAVVAIAAQSAHAVERAQAADENSRRASAFLDAVALWPREDLDRHLGVREQGHWLMAVDHPSSSVYAITLADSGGGRVLLRTALYRPAGLADAP